MMNTFVSCDPISQSIFKVKSNKTEFVLCHRVRAVPSDLLDLLDLVEPRYGYLKPPVHGSDLSSARMKELTDQVVSVHRVSVERLDLLDLQDLLDPL